MGNLITKEILKVYWNNVCGEVAGQSFYIFSNDTSFLSNKFPFELWPSHTEAKNYKLFGDHWVVWVWDVKFSTIPINWLNIVKQTFLFFLENKAIFSWCSLDGYFEDPPDLFNPIMADGYYAAITGEKEFICHTNIDEEYKGLLESDMLKLKQTLIWQTT